MKRLIRLLLVLSVLASLTIAAGAQSGYAEGTEISLLQ